MGGHFRGHVGILPTTVPFSLNSGFIIVNVYLNVTLKINKIFLCLYMYLFAYLGIYSLGLLFEVFLKTDYN